MADKKLEKLYKKWRKSKIELDRVRAEEMNLRQQIEAHMVKKDLLVVKVEDVDDYARFSRQHNYYVPSAAFTDIKANLPKDVFNEAFNVSYKLKPAVYEKLSGDCRATIEKHLTIKPSTLKAEIRNY